MKKTGQFPIGTKLVPNEQLLKHLASRPMWSDSVITRYRDTPYVEIKDWDEIRGYTIVLPDVGGGTGLVPLEIIQTMETYEE